MPNRIIFHLPFAPDKSRPSASQIRPYKMLDAFRNIGYEVDVVIGRAADREKQIRHIKREILSGERYDFVYSESSTMPTLLTEPHHLPTYPALDFGFFRFCKSHKIPVGLFYRDIHWRFDQYENNINFFKEQFAKMFYRIDLALYRTFVEILFLPSVQMKKYIPELSNLPVLPLPPGTNQVMIEKGDDPVSNEIKILYIGGLGVLYNLSLFLHTLLKAPRKNIFFTICCREDDFNNVKDIYTPLLKSDRISIVHKKGDDLAALYHNHDICCLYVQPIDYWKFAMPVKLFEYMSYGKPILGVEGTSVGDFISVNEIGWAIPYTEEALFQWLSNLPESSKELAVLIAHVKKTSQKHSWESRAEFVANSLKDIK